VKTKNENMSMFKEASKHVAKSAGSKTLHPVTDLNSSEWYKTLSVVKRKTSFWFWKKPKHIPTQITLEDMLTQKLNLDEAKFKTNVLLEQFVEKPTFKVRGDIGTKIASELNLDLSGSDDLSLTLNLGNILKTRVNWEMLQEKLQVNSVNMKHRLLKEVEKEQRTTLCVVLESLSTQGEGMFEKDSDEIVSTDDSLPIKSKISVDIHAKGSIESKCVHSFSIPPTTVLAYSCNEISISKDGYLTLHSTVDSYDSSTEFIMLRETDDNSVDAVKREFIPLLKSEKYEQLKVAFKLFSETAIEDSLQALHFLLSAAQLYLEKKSDEKNFKVSTIQHLLSDSGNQSWESLLKTLGFMLPTNFKEENAEIMLPTEDRENLVKTSIALLDALTDIEEASRKLLSTISSEHIRVMLKIVENELQGKDAKLKDTQIQNTFIKEPSTRLFLKNVGFVEMAADDTELLCYSDKSHSSLLDIFTVLYVFAN